MNTKKPKRMTGIEFFEKRHGPLTIAMVIESTRQGDEISQSAFAKILKISRSHLNDIEKGRKAVSPGRAARWARVLGYSEGQWIRLALQSILDKEGLKFKAEIKAA